MTNEDIKNLYESDDEVKKFIDSVADKRVNQYRDHFIEKDLPALVEQGVSQRLERDHEERTRLQKEEDFRTNLMNRLSGEYIDPEIGMKFFDDLGADSSEDEIESRFKDFQTIQKKTVDRVVQERLAGKAPKGGETSKPIPMEDMSYKQLLKTVGNH